MGVDYSPRCCAMLKSARNVVTVVAIVVVGLCSAFPQSNQSRTSPSSEADAKPLLLERNEGELRTRRIHIDNSATASSQFMLKVSPKNNGSQHLVAGTEEVAPGATLPKHRHLVQDEIVLVHRGMAHVWLGDQERDLHAGELAFIPANTWVSLKNMGTEPISLTFVFSAPRIRRHDAMEFRASRGSAHANHARAAERVRTLRTC